MKCGIFGDSYSNSTDDTAWCVLLEKDYTIENFSASGTSIWNAYKKFLTNYHKFDKIVFTYSIQNRFYHLPKSLERYMYIKNIHHQDVGNIVDKDDVEMFTTILKAEYHTHDPLLDHFIYQHVFNEVNRICNENKITLVNFMPFEAVDDYFTKINLENSHGPCILAVHWVSMNEKSRLKKVDNSDDRPCHLSIQNNQILYNIIRNLLINPNHKIINAKEEKIFIL